MENKKINVLVIDDSETSGILLKSLLEENEKYEVQIITSSKMAVVMDKTNFQIIFLDIMMPFINGFEVLKLLKENEKTKNIYVIMVSACNSKADINLAKSLGAYGYITKPIEEETLFELLEKI